MIKNGGYTMLDLAVATYKDAAAAFNANKPILVYDNSQVYYADTCVYDSDNDAYVITKGGKTITIDSDNNVTSEGDIKPSAEMYLHRIKVNNPNATYRTLIHIEITLPFDTPIDSQDNLIKLIQYVTNNSTSIGVMATGFNHVGSLYVNVDEVFYNGSALRCREMNLSTGNETDHPLTEGTYEYTDEVSPKLSEFSLD